MKPLVTLTAAFVHLAQPSWADEFCDDLKRIVVDAPLDFVATRGVPDADRPAHFSQPLTLAGTYRFLSAVPPCEVEPVRSGDPRMVYSCYFPASAIDLEAKDQIRVFTRRVATCLAIPAPASNYAAPHEQNPFATSNRGPFHLSAKGADVETGIFFPPDGGGGTVYFSVSAQKTTP